MGSYSSEANTKDYRYCSNILRVSKASNNTRAEMKKQIRQVDSTSCHVGP